MMMMMSFKRSFLPAAGLALLALFLRAGARLIPGFADAYAAMTNAFWVNSLGRLFSIFPFSFVEFSIYALLLLLLFRLILLAVSARARKNFPQAFGAWLLLIAVVFFLFEANEDVYFYRTPFSSFHGIGNGEYSTEDLAETARMLAEEANRYGALVQRDENGIMQLGGRAGARTAGAMEELGELYPELSGWYPRPKPIAVSRLMSLVNMSGIYSAYTIEANYNREMLPYNIPFTMSHELSHLKGILMENEANFAAYLNCMNADDADIHYSGALLGWIYCGNELYRRDRELWRGIAATLAPEVNADLDANTEFWKRMEGRASEAAESFNDSYLKAHGQADGTKSYDRVVDLIVSYENEKRTQKDGSR